MGKVYPARDTRLGREVAIKVRTEVHDVRSNYLGMGPGSILGSSRTRG
jgi:hypothetical protein